MNQYKKTIRRIFEQLNDIKQFKKHLHLYDV